MLAAATTADNSVSGYITAEQITLAASPTGTTYSWTLSKPAGSAARCALNDDTAAGPTFVPDAAGDYVVGVTVDSATTYVVRINCTQVATTTPYEAVRMSPKSDTQITAPSVGGAVFYSSTSGLLSMKRSDATIRSLEARAFTPTSSADTTGAVGDVGYDSSFIYVRTAGGWKRSALVAF